MLSNIVQTDLHIRMAKGIVSCGRLPDGHFARAGTLPIFMLDDFQTTEVYLWHSSAVRNQNGVLDVGNICYSRSTEKNV